MNTPEPCTIAVSATGQFLGWVDDGDDIGAAVASYRKVAGSIAGEVTIFKSVLWAEAAPPKTKILFRGMNAGKPFVVYR